MNTLKVKGFCIILKGVVEITNFIFFPCLLEKQILKISLTIFSCSHKMKNQTTPQSILRHLFAMFLEFKALFPNKRQTFESKVPPSRSIFPKRFRRIYVMKNFCFISALEYFRLVSYHQPVTAELGYHSLLDVKKLSSTSNFPTSNKGRMLQHCV